MPWQEQNVQEMMGDEPNPDEEETDRVGSKELSRTLSSSYVVNLRVGVLLGCLLACCGRSKISGDDGR
jgi:hypothetical protein